MNINNVEEKTEKIMIDIPRVFDSVCILHYGLKYYMKYDDIYLEKGKKGTVRT